MVLIVEALTQGFGDKFWQFIEEGRYHNKASSADKTQFYRFDKPENDSYPKMIELFSRTDFKLKEMNGLTPIHVDDEVSSLSAILLNEDYYAVLLEGKVVINELPVLRPEYLLLFKAKAYLDLNERRTKGEHVDSRDVKKHKNDILRITTEFVLEKVDGLPQNVHTDMENFIKMLEVEPFDKNLLKEYGLSSNEVVARLQQLYLPLLPNQLQHTLLQLPYTLCFLFLHMSSHPQFPNGFRFHRNT